MLIDRTSEIVAHFIGALGMAMDGARFRTDIDGFHHRADTESLFEDQSQLTAVSRIPYALEGYNPGLSSFWFSPGAQPLLPSPSLHFQLPMPTPFFGLKAKLGVDFANDIPMSGSGGQFFQITSRMHDAVAIVSDQANYLIDNDFFGSSEFETFFKPEELEQQMNVVWQTARDLTPEALVSPLRLTLEGSSLGETLTDDFAVKATAVETLAGNAVALSGSEITSVTVNGNGQGVVPDLGEVLPAYFQDQNDAAAADADIPADSFTTLPGSAADAAAHFDVENDHTVVAGGNIAINETTIVAIHADAPVIATMGNVVAVSAISQVNVIHDYNSGATNISPANTSINAATFVSAHSMAPSPAAAPVYPSNVSVAVTRVDADIISANWIHQYNYMSDHDAAQITFSGEDTFLNFGDNFLFNQTSVLEFTQGYDLIIVGNDMYNLSLIFQTNILFDDDFISFLGSVPNTASMSDNLAYNVASIQSTSIDTYVPLDDDFAQMGVELDAGATTLSDQVQNHDMFGGDVPLNILYISGSFINVSVIEQTNIIGDADQIQIEVDALLAQSDAIVTTTTGSNAAVNSASIHNSGVDSTVMVGGEVYDDLLLFQAELIETDSSPVGPAPLASEAVAFLADGMIDVSGDDTEVHLQNADVTSSDVDMMGSIIT